MRKNFIHFRLAVFIALLLALTNCSTSQTHIRVNQVGFKPNDVKTGVVMSQDNLDGATFTVVDDIKRTVAYTGKLGNNRGKFGNFANTYKFDFTGFTKKGKYYISVNNRRSYDFKIDNNLYGAVVDSLMLFFKVQRCGYTNPILHDVCHKADATSIIDGDKEIKQQLDLTGGWHDAADYVKFLNTTAYTTYTLLFAYEFSPARFGFDNDKSGVPDILEEAKIGLDWMLRCVMSDYRFITQVQDLSDHDVGWRMPENDPLEFDRPAFIGSGKNLIGIYTATMALAARIWARDIKYPEYAAKCLTAAENVFSVRDNAPDIDKSGTGEYRDGEFLGKLALGAAELYVTTQRPELLNEAKVYADSAGSDYWWSWGDVNSYAHYRIAEYDERFTEYIKNNLIFFKEKSDSSLFGEGAAFAWGTNKTLIGITLQSILYKRLTGDSTYDELAATQRDYILGRNQWGISFIHNIGSRYVKNIHHQIAHLNGGYLPGGFAAGPVKKHVLEDYNIPYEKPDRYAQFQTDSSYYRDDRMDYVTNEPTIGANATAVFVMGYYSR